MMISNVSVRMMNSCPDATGIVLLVLEIIQCEVRITSPLFANIICGKYHGFTFESRNLSGNVYLITL